MEDQSKMSSAVTVPVKWGRMGKSTMKSQHRQTIYNVYKYFTAISDQPEHSGNKCSQSTINNSRSVMYITTK
jgi:hypothetical protein